jgi:hypothetical protein
MAAFLSPIFGAGAQLFNNQGIVLSGGKIYTYQAGTTTAQTSWTDSTQVVANANPIILDSAGRPTSEIWLLSGQPYKFILTDSNNNTLGTWDNVSGVNDVSFTAAVSEWQASSLTPTYVSATSFSVPGNNVAMFQTNRRVQITVTAGTIYGYIVSSVFSTVTTVVIQPDSTSLDSGISVVNLGLLTVTHPSVPQEYPAFNAPVNVSSATSPTPIGAALSANVTITGTTTITAFDNVIAGIIRFAKFSGILTLTYNGTSLILPTTANITTAANDEAVFRSLGSGNWECISYNRASGYAFFSDFAASIQTNATAVTQAGQDNSTKIATTAYVDQQHDAQIFSANGTWTKPAWVMPNATVRVEMWGGGGGGGAGSGGGGGAYACRTFKASDLAATEAVVVGAGSAANSGLAGGNTSFSSGTKLITAYGGGGGAASNFGAGGGGGAYGAGTSGSGTTDGVGGAGYSTSGVATAAGGIGVGDAGASGLGTGAAGAGLPAFMGGGSGVHGNVAAAGGFSTYGGAGGGQTSAGLSLYGGNGGSSGVAGSIPGGGGGTNGSSTGTNGARGEVRIYIF